MRAAIFNGPRSITLGERPDPTIQSPTDAIVRVVLACVCGSDLWFYRGETPKPAGPIGHEFIGVIEDVGTEVNGLTKGDFVVAPFVFGDGTCPHCLAGWPTNCTSGGSWSNGDIDGGQGEAVRVPFADATLVRVPGSGHSDETLRSLATLCDVMCTGQHAAMSANVQPGNVVAVVGDGAVGLSAILASSRLGASRIFALSRNPQRQAIARQFGATDILTERGDEAIAKVTELTYGIGVDAALECVGTGESMDTAFGVARPGSLVGMVGAPHGVTVPMRTVMVRNVGLRGGVSPARRYIPELMADVLEGRINPGIVFDYETNLDGLAGAYEAMDERRATKSLLKVSSL
jgi:threonine dehydrogenase-like Zn-dependent dehydrogenase